MLIKKRPELLLKAAPAMVLWLGLNVLNGFLLLRHANAEGRVIFLPRESLPIIVHPF